MQEAELSILRRLGEPVLETKLVAQNNLAGTYYKLGRLEQALSLQRDVYSVWVKVYGGEHQQTLRAANNYADSLRSLRRYAEVKSLLRKTIPAARRVFEDSKEITLRMRWTFAQTLYEDPAATLDDLREAVSTNEDAERTARRVMGGANPITLVLESVLRQARAVPRARETPSSET